jgi:two-component system NtrC family response regulator
VLCIRDVLEPADFELAELDSAEDELPTLREERHRTERKLIQRALTTANGNVSEAARLLGISRPTLYELLRSLEIPVPST